MLSLGGTLAAWSSVFLAATDRTVDSGARSTAMGWALLGTLVAPSFGHWYARSLFTRGLAFRFLGGAVGLVGAAELATSTFCGLLQGTQCSSSGVGTLLLFTGSVLYAIGTIDDIATAPGEVRRYNEQHGLTIAPVIRSDRSDNHTFGLALTGQF